MRVETTTWHLEMTDPGQLRPKSPPRADLLLSRIDRPMPELNRFFYTAVGGRWYWFERLPWTWARWMDYLDRPELDTWVLAVAGQPAGYFELEQQAGGSVEVVYFGLLPDFTGQGLGGWLLSEAVRRAWALSARRVWLHTCSHDHPAALAHYQARGFRLFRTETAWEDLPDELPGPWPGAGPRRASP